MSLQNGPQIPLLSESHLGLRTVRITGTAVQHTGSIRTILQVIRTVYLKVRLSDDTVQEELRLYGRIYGIKLGHCVMGVKRLYANYMTSFEG